MINFKKLSVFILIPLAVGLVGYLLGGNTDIYSQIVKPSFVPPAFLFPIVWTILYILMGISFYIVANTDSNYTASALKVYIAQLAVNALWPLFFFRLNLFLFSFLWIILLIVLVGYMIYLFYKIKPIAAYLQIPYLLWLIFASILNFAVYSLN